MLHPQARALIDLIESRGLPPTHTLPPVEARAFYRERRSFTQPDAPEVAEVRELRAPGPLGDIPLRAYRPLGAAPDAALPVLVPPPPAPVSGEVRVDALLHRLAHPC